jgi:hypothetical protein
LAQAGIIDNYDYNAVARDKNTLTRYAMATLVAEAMANEGKATAGQKAETDH